MIRALFIFAVLFGGFWVGISALRKLSGLEKWELTKTLSYAIICAVLTMLVLAFIVILF